MFVKIFIMKRKRIINTHTYFIELFKNSEKSWKILQKIFPNWMKIYYENWHNVYVCILKDLKLIIMQIWKNRYLYFT